MNDKNLHNLKLERFNKIEEMETITRSEKITPDEKKRFDKLDNEVQKLNNDIQLATRREEMNIKELERGISVQTTSVEKGAEFRDWLQQSITGSKSEPFKIDFNKQSLRADPLLTTTDTNLINKTVAETNIVVSPGEDFLKQLGVSFFTGLNGTLVLPALPEDTATFKAETVTADSANMEPETITMNPRRVTHTQSYTVELLNQTNPEIFASIVDNLVTGVWNAVTNDLFDNIETDAASQIGTISGSTIDYNDLVNMEASLGGINLDSPSYVMDTQVKAYLKKTPVFSGGDHPIWTDDKVNGYLSYGVPAANPNNVYFGDWKSSVVGVWGSGIDLVVDPFTGAADGIIKLTVVGLFDTAIKNPRSFVINDASVY